MSNNAQARGETTGSVKQHILYIEKYCIPRKNPTSHPSLSPPRQKKECHGGVVAATCVLGGQELLNQKRLNIFKD